MKKKTIILTCCIFLMVVFSMMLGCGKVIHKTDEAWYFEHPMTVELLTKKCGKPDLIRRLGNGVEERIYVTRNTGVSSKYSYTCKDGMVIKSGLIL